MRGAEVWEYCNAVVKDLDLKIDRNNAEFAEIIEKLDGNPLAIRAVLLRLQNLSARRILAELEKEFTGAEGDESTERIQAAFNILEHGIDRKFSPILQLIGLHEHYVYADHIGYMLKYTNFRSAAAHIAECFTMLENAGFCDNLGDGVYKTHPVLRSCLAKKYPASEELQREFVDIMGNLSQEFTPKELHEQRIPFMLNEANFYRAMDIAENLGMEDHNMALISGACGVHAKQQKFSASGKIIQRTF
jgi:hypothetical protein